MRGSLLDVFPMGAATPLRIDLFDDEIEAIRRFDPDTQRSLDTLTRVRLLPAREVPLDAPGGQGLPPPLPHALRGRPDPQRHLPRRERGARAGRSGVLPAAVLRSHRDARRLPAAGCGDRAGCGAARRAGARLERDRRALRGSPPRHRASAAFARRSCFSTRSSSPPGSRRSPPSRSSAFKADLELQGAPHGAQLPHRRAARAAHRRARRAAVRPARRFPARVPRPRAARRRLGRAGARCCRRCCARTATR